MSEEGLVYKEAEGDPLESFNQPSSRLSVDGKLEAVLRAVAEHAETIRDPGCFLSLLLERIVKVMAADVALLFSWGGDQTEWNLVAHHGFPKDFGKGEISRAWQSLPTIVFRQGPHLFSNDVSKDSRFVGQVIRGMNVQSFAGVTLYANEKRLGSFALGFFRPDALSPKDHEIFLLISNLLCPALANEPAPDPCLSEDGSAEKEFSAGSTEAKILEILLSGLSYPSQREDLFKEILEKCLPLMHAEGGYIMQFYEKRQRFFPVAHQGLSPDRAEHLVRQGVKMGENILGKILQRKEPSFLNAHKSGTHLNQRLVGEEGLQSYVGVPITDSSGVWGTLSLFCRGSLFSKEDQERGVFLGRQLGYLVDNRRLFDEAHQRALDLVVVNECGQSLSKSLYLEHLYASAVASMTKLIGAAHAYIFSLDDQKNILCGVAASPQRLDAVRKMVFRMNGNTLIPLTARDKHPYVIEHAFYDPKVGKVWADTFKSKSLLSVPLVSKERVIGVILLDETHYFRSFTAEDIQKIESFSRQVSIAIDNATVYQSAIKQVERLKTLSSAMINIEEEVRRHTVHEIQSKMGGVLSDIQANIEWLERKLYQPDIEMTEKIETIKSQAGRALESMERLSYELHPKMLDEAGLIPTLKWYVDDYSRRNSVAVHLQTHDLEKRFSAKTEVLFYRIIQEALANVSKHAKAESVILSLEKKEALAYLYVTDDGAGFDVRGYFSAPPAMKRGLGIWGMKERVELAGGTFFVDSSPGHGTRISIKVPIMRKGLS